ncbi:ABC transporter substrate-binding protein [Roseomonas sp. GC11]|uniref:ABC transporter substrate-binding protein n=1 Tax=Roseomonas sp. GC11 TaxID=2950546 RepID=UPI00210A50BD|nr:ABC transporter substrate-binding protein [Roseomonas sp. GC11]MCQ4159115.1 ABC transporter substrate-binding protein [Roseomonas sp. GC11]
MDRRSFLLGASSAAAFFSYNSWRAAYAETPKSVLVVAQQLDNVTSLDPHESFEAVAGEIANNMYQRLVRPHPERPEELLGDLAERWEVMPGGGLRFTLRADARFASGAPVTAEDAAFSLARAVTMNKAPAFILTQFGFTRENAAARLRARDARTLEVEPVGQHSPAFLLYCLSANVGSIVEKAALLAHAQGDDLGNGWLRQNSAGSGPWALRSWKPSESAILEATPQRGAGGIRRIILRHVVDPSTQLLMLRTGDVDIARNLTTEQIKALQGQPGFELLRRQNATLMLLQMNVAHPALSKVAVRQAIKWAIDYESIQANLAALTHQVHQSFLPRGFPGAVTETTFRKDPARARALLAEAGLADGFEITLDHYNAQPYPDIAQALQADLAAIGIRLRMLPGENRQVLTKTRSRQHEMALTAWGADYFDPNTNAEAFCVNADNGPEARARTLAWRNNWQDAAMTERSLAALAETDGTRRLALYEALQRDHMQASPFAFLLQGTTTAACRKGVEGVRLATMANDNSYAEVRKP